MANTVNTGFTISPLPKPDAFRRMGGSNTDLRVAYSWFTSVNQIVNDVATVTFFANANSVLAFDQANTARNTANAAYGEANLAFSVAVLAYNEANADTIIAEAAYAQANIAYNTANLAFIAANSAQTEANAANVLAQTVFAAVNTTFATINTEIVNINTALGNTNTTFGTVNSTFDTINTAITAAANVDVFVNGTSVGNSQNINIVSGNTSNLSIVGSVNVAPGNTTITFDTRNPPGTGGGGNSGSYQVDVLANGIIVLANANVNFNNTSTINVSVIANGTSQANIAFAVNTAITNTLASLAYTAANSAQTESNNAYAQANIAFSTANSASNSVAVFANGNLILSNSSVNFNNTATVNVFVVANGSGQSNVSFQANTTALSTIVTDDVFVSANGQTIFNCSSNIVSSITCFVLRNGVTQVPTTDYTSNGSNSIVLTTSTILNEEIEVRNFAAIGSLVSGGGGGGSSKVVVSNITLGTQNPTTTFGTYIMYAIPSIATRGISSNLTVTTNSSGLYDIIIAGNANGNVNGFTPGNGSLWWNSTDITANIVSDSTVWYYESDFSDGNLYIGCRNRGLNPLTFTLSFLRIEKFA